MSCALAVPALLTGNAPALAYDGCQSESSISASVAEAAAGVPINLNIDVRNCNGAGVEGAQVVFGTQSAPAANCQAAFNPGQATSDASGGAPTQATLPAGCPCVYVLSARVPTSSGGFTLTTTVRESGCLPFTSTAAAPAPASSHAGSPPGFYGALIGIVALLVVAATGAAIRRRV